MNNYDFVILMTDRFRKIIETMDSKGSEYSTNEDKLHNFKRAGEMQRCTPEKALMGMLAKHLVSVLDIIDKTNDSVRPSEKLIDEKIGDSINYFILLEALLKERLKND